MTTKPLKTVEVGEDAYVVAILTRAQVERIADAVVKALMESSLDIVLADRIRNRMAETEEAALMRELDAEHRRQVPTDVILAAAREPRP